MPFNTRPQHQAHSEKTHSDMLRMVTDTQSHFYLSAGIVSRFYNKVQDKAMQVAFIYIDKLPLPQREGVQAFFVEMGLHMFASGHYATHQEHSLSASTL